jgi:hypothetical protein
MQEPDACKNPTYGFQHWTELAIELLCYLQALDQPPARFPPPSIPICLACDRVATSGAMGERMSPIFSPAADVVLLKFVKRPKCPMRSSLRAPKHQAREPQTL